MVQSEILRLISLFSDNPVLSLWSNQNPRDAQVETLSENMKLLEREPG